MTSKSELHCDDPTKSEPAAKPGKRVVPRSCDCDKCVPMYTSGGPSVAGLRR